jgi:hypothetical protein
MAPCGWKWLEMAVATGGQKLLEAMDGGGKKLQVGAVIKVRRSGGQMLLDTGRISGYGKEMWLDVVRGGWIWPEVARGCG